MVAALSLPANKSIDDDLVNLLERLAKVNAHVQANVEGFQLLKGANQSLYLTLLRSRDVAKALNEAIDELSQRNLTLFSRSLRNNPKHYKELKLTQDYINKRLAICKDIRKRLGPYNKEFGLSLSLINFLFSRKVRRVNKEIFAYSNQSKAKLDRLLAKLETADYKSAKYLQEVSADELWENRCEVYDYLL